MEFFVEIVAPFSLALCILTLPVALLLSRYGRKIGIGWLAAGFAPTVLILAAALAGHAYWLLSEGAAGHSAYSPAIVLLVGFPEIVISLCINLAASRWATK